CARHYPGDYW
nr:immunoglobulin heavy chain junction region [Mus musculus]